MYPHAIYTRNDDGTVSIVPSSLDPVRWSSIKDPSDPYSLPPDARPITVDVHAGDTLYLPAGWWHYVRQQDTTIAINWWYDLEPRGMNWVWLNFLRGGPDEVPGGNDDTEEDVL
jgi:jumonji domain-containing protein 7